MNKINKTQLKAIDKYGEYIDIHPVTYAENVLDRSGNTIQHAIDDISNNIDMNYYNKLDVDKRIEENSPSISFNKSQKKFTLTKKMTREISKIDGYKLLSIVINRSLEHVAIFIKDDSPSFRLNVYEKTKEVPYITSSSRLCAIMEKYDPDGGYWYHYNEIYDEKINIPLYNTKSICYTTNDVYNTSHIVAHKSSDIRGVQTVPFILTCTNNIGMLKYKGKRGEVLYNTEKKCLCVMDEFNKFIELGNSELTSELENKYDAYIKNIDKSIKDRLSKL